MIGSALPKLRSWRRFVCIRLLGAVLAGKRLLTDFSPAFIDLIHFKVRVLCDTYGKVVFANGPFNYWPRTPGVLAPERKVVDAQTTPPGHAKMLSLKYGLNTIKVFRLVGHAYDFDATARKGARGASKKERRSKTEKNGHVAGVHAASGPNVAHQRPRATGARHGTVT